MKRLVILAAIMLSLASCASSGTKVDEGRVAQLVKGQTTMDQAIAALGKPTSTTAWGQGTMLGYTYTEISSRPASFIPFIGPFVGGTDMTSSNVFLMFDGAGVLTDVRSTSSEIGTQAGRG